MVVLNVVGGVDPNPGPLGDAEEYWGSGYRAAQGEEVLNTHACK